jgi:hypothetical protein
MVKRNPNSKMSKANSSRKSGRKSDDTGGNSPDDRKTPFRIDRFVSDDPIGISVLKPMKPVQE